MIDLAVVTTKEMTESELRNLVTEFGAKWISGSPFGKIDRPDAYIEIDSYPASAVLEADEIEEFRARHGVGPASVVGIHWSGLRRESRGIARSIADRVLAGWGGELED